MLLRKLWRDILQHKAQFISIFLMAFLGMYIYSGISGEWMGLKNSIDNYYNETNMADIWIYYKSFNESDVEKIREIQGVKDVERRLTIKGIGDFENNPEITMNFLENKDISKPYTISGEDFTLDKKGIWLDHQFADKKNLNIGDFITIKVQDIKVKLEILGTIYSPEYVYAPGEGEIIPDHDSTAFAYLSIKSLPDYIPVFYNQLIIKTEDNNYKKYTDKITDVLKNKYNLLLSRDDLPSNKMFQDEISQHRAMGTIFPIVFLAIAALTILTTMTRIVNKQRGQIGILKALGFKKSKIIFHYLSYGFYLSAIGALLGATLGPITLPKLFYESLMTSYTIPKWEAIITSGNFIIALLTILLCTVASYFACRNILKLIPAETLRPKEPTKIKGSVIEKMKLWNSLGFNIQWNIRDIMRNKVRSLMAIIGVIGCSGLLICALGLKNSIDYIVKWQYNDISNYDYKIIMDEKATDKDRNYIKNNYNGEGVYEDAIEIKVNDNRKSASILVKDDTDLVRETDENGAFITLPKRGISISRKMAELLNVSLGDEISWQIYGSDKWVGDKITGIYRNPTVQGIIIWKDYYEELGNEFIPNVFLSNNEIPKIPTGVESIKSIDTQIDSYEILIESMNTMVYILIIAAIVLGVVVLYNLGILTFVEMERELATLKVIGFKSKIIRRLLLTQNIFLTTIGIVVGIPIGVELVKLILSFLGDSMDMMIVINNISYIYTIIFTFVISIFVNRLFSKRVKSINMVSSLKSVE